MVGGTNPPVPHTGRLPRRRWPRRPRAAHDVDAWETSTRSRFFVHLLNSLQVPPCDGYRAAHQAALRSRLHGSGLPWFEYYATDRKALEGASKLLGLDSVATMKVKQGKGVLEGNEPVSATNVKVVSVRGNIVREGDF